jgi:four helix bundle protein
MAPNEKSKTYDLEDRTQEFARQVREFIRKLPRTLSNAEDAKLLVRALGSVGANYIEANESLSKKDFAVRVKICRKEAKESRYWFRPVYLDGQADLVPVRDGLVQEAVELTSIFGAIVRKVEGDR